MKKLCSVDLVSENCEYSVIPLELISFMQIEKINKSIALLACGNIDEVEMTDYFKIGIKSDALGIETNCAGLLLDQLHRCNISQICLNYDREGTETYYCAWSEENYDKNLFQDNNFEHEGLVVVSIIKQNNQEKEN
jgi:hypothetical protein